MPSCEPILGLSLLPCIEVKKVLLVKRVLILKRSVALLLFISLAINGFRVALNLGKEDTLTATYAAADAAYEIGLKSNGRRLYAVKMSASGTKIVKLNPIEKRNANPTDPDGEVIQSGPVSQAKLLC